MFDLVPGLSEDPRPPGALDTPTPVPHGLSPISAPESKLSGSEASAEGP